MIVEVPARGEKEISKASEAQDKAMRLGAGIATKWQTGATMTFCARETPIDEEANVRC